jgi:hypothetical protein
MEEYKDILIRHIEQKASKKAEELFKEFVSEKSEDKEEILAGIEFENWLADSCHDCLKE